MENKDSEWQLDKPVYLYYYTTIDEEKIKRFKCVIHATIIEMTNSKIVTNEIKVGYICLSQPFTHDENNWSFQKGNWMSNEDTEELQTLLTYKIEVFPALEQIAHLIPNTCIIGERDIVPGLKRSGLKSDRYLGEKVKYGVA